MRPLERHSTNDWGADCPALTIKRDPVRHDENSIETPDGDERLIAWSNTILRNPDGSVYGAASIGQDITEQRAAEAALRASEQRFRTLSTLAPVGIFSTGAAGRS